MSLNMIRKRECSLIFIKKKVVCRENKGFATTWIAIHGLQKLFIFFTKLYKRYQIHAHCTGIVPLSSPFYFFSLSLSLFTFFFHFFIQ